MAEGCERMFRIRKTCWEMLGDRRYLVPDVSACAHGGRCVRPTRAAPPAHAQLRSASSGRCRPTAPAKPAAALALQEERNMSLPEFRDRYGDHPSKAELTILASQIDDPVKKVTRACSCQMQLVWLPRSGHKCRGSSLFRRPPGRQSGCQSHESTRCQPLPPPSSRACRSLYFTPRRARWA
jgi:hypothetical protein